MFCFIFVWCPWMTINANVQHNGGFLLGIIQPVLSTCPLHTNSGCGKERRILIGPWWPAKAALVRNYPEVYWPCAGGLSAVNAKGWTLPTKIWQPHERECAWSFGWLGNRNTHWIDGAQAHMCSLMNYSSIIQVCNKPSEETYPGPLLVNIDLPYPHREWPTISPLTSDRIGIYKVAPLIPDILRDIK